MNYLHEERRALLQLVLGDDWTVAFFSAVYTLLKLIIAKNCSLNTSVLTVYHMSAVTQILFG
jgi:hypothetical protein